MTTDNAYPPQQCVEKCRDVLFGGVGKVDLNHIGHLVAIAVDEVGLERPEVGCQERGDILLRCCALDLFSPLPLRRGR